MDLKPLVALLRPRTMTDSYKQTQSPTQFRITETFYKSPIPVSGDNYEYLFYPQMRRPSSGNVTGAEARIVTTGPVRDKKAKLFCLFNKVILPTAALDALEEPTSPILQQAGADAVARVMTEFSIMNRMFREVVLSQILTIGRVNLDNDMNILQPTVNASSGAITDASGAVIKADFGVANTHRGNLNGIISSLWTDPTTKISDQLENLKDAAEAAGVEEPTEIWLHSIRKNDLRSNDQYLEWAPFNQGANAAVLAGRIENLWGFNWNFYGGKYEDPLNPGTFKDVIPKTSAVICPASTGAWIQASAGLTRVPKTLDVVTDAAAAVSATLKTYGEFAYAKLIDDPLAIYQFMGDMFGLNFADPDAIWMPSIA